jgi:glycosyltransferase involved in cell wall biosynthesis
LFKSNYHLEEFNKFFKTNLNKSKYEIIPNGVLVDKFSFNSENIKRNPYRFCYVSYYTRGLFHIIPYIFNIMKQIEPRVELHLYYGMDMFNDDNLKLELKKLTCQQGVIDHGRQCIDIIAREKYMSTFQLYITNTISEIDCISIKESLVAGCIPLISNFGVFKEREGIHFELNEKDINSMKDIAINIINFAKNQKQVEILSNCLKNSETIMDWYTIANKIENIILN